MNAKEKEIQENKRLIDELSKMPPMVIATAYLYAVNYTSYGVDVTEKWVTATQNAAALEKAYRDGYYDALKRKAESEEYRTTFNNLCNSCSNIGCEFQSGIVRTKCAFYMPPHMESDNCGNYIVMPQQS